MHTVFVVVFLSSVGLLLLSAVAIGVLGIYIGIKEKDPEPAVVGCAVMLGIVLIVSLIGAGVTQ